MEFQQGKPTLISEPVNKDLKYSNATVTARVTATLTASDVAADVVPQFCAPHQGLRGSFSKLGLFFLIQSYREERNYTCRSAHILNAGPVANLAPRRKLVLPQRRSTHQIWV
ncbi:hypothetical protein BVC80_1173g29 [Macleaya cordata]|uniref:Uncharacterized protein n=1 Tax=Macleaya cordata TaxID=56857 RepID=A0A200QIK3_MACCD|nr:hypothetical protein BVC80_1173g29 [Macleaya cordata]